MTPAAHSMGPPYTEAVRRALQGISDPRLAADLLFLEAWERDPVANLGVTLRAGQIRRANPGLAAAIGAELRAQSGLPDKPVRTRHQLD